MKKMSLATAIPLVLFIILGGFLGRALFLNPHQLNSVQVGKTLPAVLLPDLTAKEPFNTANLKGKLFLLNIWASWCESCAEEQLFLVKLARKGIPIYGLNYKDNPVRARRWLNEWGNPYRAIGVDKQGKMAMDLGVYGTPETFLIDSEGKIRYRHVGVLNEKIWRQAFLPFLERDFIPTINPKDKT